MIGKRLSPILSEIEETLWEFEVSMGGIPKFTDEGFRAAIKIFMAAVIDKAHDLQLKENMDMEDKCKMAENIGRDLRKFVKTYTDIDTHDLYQKK